VVMFVNTFIYREECWRCDAAFIGYIVRMPCSIISMISAYRGPSTAVDLRAWATINPRSG
jgi:hypothetical protein